MIDQMALLERVSFWAESARVWADLGKLHAEGGHCSHLVDAREQLQTKLIHARGALAQAAEALRKLESWKPAVPLPGDDGWDL